MDDALPGRGDVAERTFPTGTTMLRSLAAARWLTWLWMVGVVTVAATRDVETTSPSDDTGLGTAFRQPALAWSCVAAVLVMCVLGTIALRDRTDRVIRPAFAVAEGVLALTLSIVDGWVFDPGHVFETSQSLATQYPLIAMATLGLTFGPWVAASVGVLVGPAELWAAHLNRFGPWSLRHTFSIIATSIFFAAAGALFGWLSTLLRRVEGEIADQRARDEVGRVLHDTVLQTLALVETRTADSDPDLARAARDADRDLRRFLFGAASKERHTLESRIRSTVERACAHHDVDVTVNVLDDGCRASAAAQNALAGAVGEAVVNAIKHADAGRITVFVETDEAGEVFASVRDDGLGFELDRVDRGRGLDHSIGARMRDVGGRSNITSAPGRGTEVELWTSNGAGQ
jgi:signal transduction histidine kinase